MAHALAYEDAYKQTLRETDDPRAMERRVFAQITGELEAADAAPRGAERMRKLIGALERNQDLWGKILFDLADPANELSESLRAQLISLSLFVDRHTGAVLAGKAEVAPLVRLNRSIMLGLSGVRPQESAQLAEGGPHGTAH